MGEVKRGQVIQLGMSPVLYSFPINLKYMIVPVLL